METLLPIIRVSTSHYTREGMPQIEDEYAFIYWLREQGVRVHALERSSHLLLPTQNEINLEKVVGIARNGVGEGGRVLVCRPTFDSHIHILDGHHRWYAAKFLRKRLPVWLIELPHPRAVKMANHWVGVVHHAI